ncbi:hypothetical protein [Paenibacillus sp. J2TS4]|nr:hypothetical protein [Paenibacillus sp. J2TS4]
MTTIDYHFRLVSFVMCHGIRFVGLILFPLFTSVQKPANGIKL